MNNSPPPPRNSGTSRRSAAMKRSLTFALAALALACVAPLKVQAQAPPSCNRSICTVAIASVSPVVDGCGDHATPGRMKVIFSSTNSSVTRASFPVAGYFIQAISEFRRTTFSEWEWRNALQNNNRWNDPVTNRIGWAGGALGENIVEVRPKAGAHVWSNRNPNNPNQGPGELVVQNFDLPAGGTTPYQAPGTAYFMFMGGKGCARVGPGGERLGGNQ